MSTTRVAVIQLNANADRTRNEEQAHALVDQAAAAGATFVALPENADQIAPREERLAAAEPLTGPLVSGYRALARKHGLWLLLGSFGEKADSERLRNTSVLIDPAGALAAVYRKIHLFDADPPDGIAYRESATVAPGTEVVTAATPFGTVGLSICYDLRFPELYRALSARGACVQTVPAAFTVPTGQAHWEVLLRARAIENLSYVVAPAQVGDNGHGRRTWGHALVVDPWGTILASADGEQPGFAVAEIRSEEIERVRRLLPALEHRRL